jgi:hypothetical protein
MNFTAVAQPVDLLPVHDLECGAYLDAPITNSTCSDWNGSI